MTETGLFDAGFLVQVQRERRLLSSSGQEAAEETTSNILVPFRGLVTISPQSVQLWKHELNSRRSQPFQII